MRYFPVILLILFAGCKRSGSMRQPPIGEESFVALLTDIRLLEGSYTVKYRGMDQSDLASWYAQVFARHGVTEEDFRKSLMIYYSDPAQMLTMEDAVLEKLSELLAAAQSGRSSGLPDAAEKETGGGTNSRLDGLK